MNGTGNSPQATGQPHPRWCTPECCQMRNGGFHSSETIHVAVNRSAGSNARLRLRLYALDLGFPMLEILVTHLDHTTRTRVDISLGDASALYHAIATMLARADPTLPTVD
jgi:hypothetical protein